jgi:hypothetical protein
MAYRVSLRFNQQSSRIGGWSENFWLNTTDLTSALNQCNALRSAMTFAKGHPVVCPSYRISVVDSFRQAEVVKFPVVPQSTESFDADYPTTKIQLRFAAPVTGGLAKTLQWFGGVQDSWITNSGNYVPTGGSAQAFSRLFALLTSNTTNWSIRVLDPTRAKFLIKAIDPVTGIVTTNTNTLAVDSMVRIKGVKGLLAANGVWRITVIDSTHFSMNGWVPTTTVMTKGDPTVRPQTYTLLKIQACKAVQSTSHKVGKPLDQLSGKSKKKTS